MKWCVIVVDAVKCMNNDWKKQKNDDDVWELCKNAVVVALLIQIKGIIMFIVSKQRPYNHNWKWYT